MTRSVHTTVTLILYVLVPVGVPPTVEPPSRPRVGGRVSFEDDVDALANALLAASVHLRQSESPEVAALGERLVSAAAALWAHAASTDGGVP